MTSIDPHARLAALVRSQVRRTDAASRPAPAAAHARASPDAAALAVQGLRGLAADDPDRARKALAVYLEAVLLQEFGQGLLEDPAFPTLVQAVQEQIQQEPELAAAAQGAAEVLLRRVACKTPAGDGL